MIHLDGDLYMDADDNCISIISWDGTTRKQKGEMVPVISRRRYYPTLESAFHGFHKIMALESVKNSSTIDELLSEYNAIRRIFQDMFWEDPEVKAYISNNKRKGRADTVERILYMHEGARPSDDSDVQNRLQSDLDLD